MAPPSTGTLVSSGPIGTDVLMNKVAPSEARRTGSMRPVAMTAGLLIVVSPVLDDSQENGEKSRMIGICCGNRA